MTQVAISCFQLAFIVPLVYLVQIHFGTSLAGSREIFGTLLDIAGVMMFLTGFAVLIRENWKDSGISGVGWIIIGLLCFASAFKSTDRLDVIIAIILVYAASSVAQRAYDAHVWFSALLFFVPPTSCFFVLLQLEHGNINLAYLTWFSGSLIALFFAFCQSRFNFLQNQHFNSAQV